MMLAQGNDYLSLHEGQHGGANSMNPAPAPPGYTGILDDGLRQQAFMNPIDQSMKAIQGMSDMMGGRRTRKMRGGAVAINPAPAPVGDTGMLDANLRAQAGVNPIDQSIQSIQGMSDQSGGGRRRRKIKATRRGKRKSKASRKTRQRKMRGGSAYTLSTAQDVGAPGMLLSPGQEAKALESMNPEWKLATDPNSFAPSIGK